MATVLKRASRLPFAPIVAGLFSLVAAILVMATPIWLLESWIAKTGLAELVSAAAPPLGAKARALTAILAALTTGGLLWAILSVFERRRIGARFKMPATEAKAFDVRAFQKDVPSVAPAATANPYPSSRGPILADRELGAPFMSDEALADAPILPAAIEEDFDPNELVLDQHFVEAATDYAEQPAETFIQLDPPARAETFDIVEPFDLPEAAEMPVPLHNIVRSIPVAVEPELPPAAHSFSTAQPLAQAIPVPPPAEGYSPDTLSALVDRLEGGLEQRAAALAAVQAAADAAMAVQAVEQVSPSTPKPVQAPLGTAQQEVDSALRQALNTLERLAAGGKR